MILLNPKIFPCFQQMTADSQAAKKSHITKDALVNEFLIYLITKCIHDKKL